MQAFPPGSWRLPRPSFASWSDDLKAAVQTKGVSSAYTRIDGLGARLDLLLAPVEEYDEDGGFGAVPRSSEAEDRMKMPPPPPTQPKPRATSSKKKAPVEKEDALVPNDPSVRICFSSFRP